MKEHSCEAQLSKDIKINALLDSARATDGDLWTCSCGRKYEHYCSEAEGCGWQEMKDESK